MGKYLLIESRDPFDSSDSDYFHELVEGLSKRGNDVVLFLIQNGVLPVRKGSKYNGVLSKLIQGKVKVMADRFSLKERAIRTPVGGVEVADVERLVDLLLEPGTKAIWH
jgi:hypothetical protein